MSAEEEREGAAAGAPPAEVGASNRRCKLYQSTGFEWIAVGVGHASVELKEEGGGKLLLIDEADARNLWITHAIEPGTAQNYQHQQDTLILFTNRHTQEEYGLSFEEPTGCMAVWEALMSAAADGEMMDAIDIFLPNPTEENLEEIANSLKYLLGLGRGKEPVIQQLLDGYILQLFTLYEEVEKQEKIASLHLIWRIFRDIFLFNSAEVLKFVLANENIARVIACFEYNPNRPGKRMNHRAFLASVRFRNPLNFDHGLTDRIRQLYLIQYLKESVVASVLEEPVQESINLYHLYCRNDLLKALACDDGYIAALFNTLQDPDASDDQREALILLTQDIVVSTKTLPVQHKVEFFEFLVKRGLLNVLTACIPHSNPRVRGASADILWNLDINLIRTFSLSESEKSAGCPLLRVIFTQFINEDIEGLQHQWQEGIVRPLVEVHSQKYSYATATDPSALDMPPEFMSVLYERLPPNLPNTLQAPPLIDLFFHPVIYHPLIIENAAMVPPTAKQFLDLRRANTVLYLTLPIISCCVLGHTVRMNTYLLAKNVPQKIISLLSHRSKLPIQLILSIIWFIKALVASLDECMFKHIIKHNLLDPLFKLLKVSRNFSSFLPTLIIGVTASFG
ncbi:Suppressor of Mek1, partial [Diplonema papillatum]